MTSGKENNFLENCPLEAAPRVYHLRFFWGTLNSIRNANKLSTWIRPTGSPQVIYMFIISVSRGP